MTKRELIERLGEFPDDAEIKITIHDPGNEVTHSTSVNTVELYDPPGWPGACIYLYLDKDGRREQ